MIPSSPVVGFKIKGHQMMSRHSVTRHTYIRITNLEP
jgi:hypothetical protein